MCVVMQLSPWLVYQRQFNIAEKDEQTYLEWKTLRGEPRTGKPPTSFCLQKAKCDVILECRAVLYNAELILIPLAVSSLFGSAIPKNLSFMKRNYKRLITKFPVTQREIQTAHRKL